MPENKSNSPGLSIHILGIGEITTTIEVRGGRWGKVHPIEKRWMRLAYKRMPAFDTREAMEHYLKAHLDYQDLLDSLGIKTPWHDNLTRQRADGKWVVYNRQERFPSNQVACLMIRDRGGLGMEAFKVIVSRLDGLFIHNLENPDRQIGFDAQISNWVFPEYDPENPRVREGDPLLYIDTSTPMLRYDQVEQLDTELFLKSVPAVFRPLIRHTILQQVLDRYYVPREVILDLTASYITHQRPDLVPKLTREANRLMAASAYARDAKPFTVKEIRAYHREDVMIWQFFRTLKRMDRYVSERLLGKKYEQRLPSGSPKKWRNLVGAGGMGLAPEDEDLEVPPH